jgi:hypothetical protein
METSRNLPQLVKGNPLYSALHGVYADVLKDLKDILKESAAMDMAAIISVKKAEANKEFNER